jgi:ferrochelatase
VSSEYDALLLLSFGGPEGPDDVLPFLENVVRGRGVPRERLLEVAEHYSHFGGVSPINEQNRALLAAVRAELDLPVYWGNRNWHPLVEDTVATMRADGVRRALVFVTSAYTSYSGCRQYQDDLARARAAVGDGAPELDKLRHYFNHPGFIEPAADGVRPRWSAGRTPGWCSPRTRSRCRWRPPAARAGTSTPRSCGRRPGWWPRRSAGRAPSSTWSGSPGPGRRRCPGWSRTSTTTSAALAAAGTARSVVSPIGFVSDHVEVLWDLDEEAAATAAKLGLDYARASTVGTDPRFVRMVGQLVEERYGRRAQARPRADGPEPRRLPAGLLPGPAPPALSRPSTVAVHSGPAPQRCRDGTAL